MADIPEGVVPTDIAVKILGNIIAESYKQVTQIVSKGNFTTQAGRNDILKQLKDLSDQSDKRVQDWVKVQIPNFYEQGLFEANKTIHNKGDEVKILKEFQRFHKEAIQAIAEDTYSNIASAMQGITKTGNKFVSMGARQSILEKIGTGTITGSTRKGISKSIKDELRQNGITGLIDKGGREWDLNRYSEMLARTKLTQAHNTAVTNRMLESGYDLVQVSAHFGSCELCRPFEGKVLSVSGRNKAFVSVDQATAEGLFHPNCRHKILPVENPYLDESVIYNPESGSYIPYKEYTIEKLKIDEDYIKALLKSEIPSHLGKSVFRAEDSKGAGALLGSGKYFSFNKDYVKKYGTDIKEYYLNPNVKMLELNSGRAIDKFEEEVRTKFKDRTIELINKHGTQEGFAKAITEYAKSLGYDGIISDDQAFGSVVFDPKNLITKQTFKASKVDSILLSDDLRKYEVAFNKGDLRTLEYLRSKHITDSRFKIHAEYGTVTKEQTLQAFKDITAKHNESLTELGIEGIAEFNRLLEKGNKQKIIAFINKLDPKKSLVQEMYTMANFL